MKLILALAALVAVASALPLDKDVQTLRLENDNIGVDGYKFGYDLSDGTSRQEEAVVKNIGSEQEAIAVRGVVSWVAPDGQKITLSFVADENGYHPEGAHLPKI